MLFLSLDFSLLRLFEGDGTPRLEEATATVDEMKVLSHGQLFSYDLSVIWILGLFLYIDGWRKRSTTCFKTARWYGGHKHDSNQGERSEERENDESNDVRDGY